MTPFGARVRSLRQERGVRLADLAAGLQVTPAYLSALEHGRRGAPSPGLVHQVCEYFGLIWDDAEELARLARISHPRVRMNAAGLSPEQTALANRLQQTLARLPPETVAAMLALLEATRLPPRPRPARRGPPGGGAKVKARGPGQHGGS